MDDGIGLKIKVSADTRKFSGDWKKTIDDAYAYLDKKSNMNDFMNNFVKGFKKGAATTFNVIKSIVSALFTAELLIITELFSAFTMLFSGAMGIVKKENQEIVNKLTYIKAMLQSAYRALSDIATKFMNWILDGIIKIAYWADYIIQRWFGISLLQQTGSEYAKNMKEAEKSAGNIKKQLMGFDEANVLNDNDNGKEKPLIPTSWSPGQIDVPEWVKWIARNKDLIIGLASAVGIAFGAVQTASVISNIAKIFGIAGPAAGVGGSGLLGLFTSLLAITAIAAGIAIIAVVAAKTWQDLEKLGNEIEQISEKQAKFNQEFKKSLDPAKDLDKLTNTAKVNIQGGRDLLKSSNSWWTKIRGNSDKYLEAAKKVVESSDATVEKAKEMYEYEGRTAEEKSKILSMLTEQYNYNQDVISALEKEGKDTTELKNITQKYRDLIYQISGDLYTNNNLTDRQKNQWNEINKSVDGVTRDIIDLNNIQVKDKQFNIDGKIKIDQGNLSSAIDKALTLYASTNNSWLKMGFTPIINAIKTFKAKYNLAGGGIVNLPGRGVPLSSIHTGEAGAEGVIPLTNPHAMSQLGQEIGKWVNIAIDNRMEVDGRVLATTTNNAINKERFLMNR